MTGNSAPREDSALRETQPDGLRWLIFAAGRIFNTRLRLGSCSSLKVPYLGILCGLRQASGEA